MRTAHPLGAREFVDLHESTIDPEARRALGAHYTPESLAARLVALAAGSLGRVPRRVCDPSCGAGSVLLAAADHLVSVGVPVSEVLDNRLVGFDIDPEAVAAAAEALRRWATDRGLDDPPMANVWVGDALDPTWAQAVRERGQLDMVVGNPPFASPLSADWTPRTLHAGEPAGVRTARVGGAYTDASAAHLTAALELVDAEGVVCMLQPQSLLGARDAGRVREWLMSEADLVTLWATDEQLFDASVEVCAPVLIRHPDLGPADAAGSNRPEVFVYWRDEAPVIVAAGRGARDESAPRSVGDGSPSNWSPLLGVLLGVPDVRSSEVGVGRDMKDLATCTAGFRDEFYALAEVAVELPEHDMGSDAGLGPHDSARLVTSGMIDPGKLSWGQLPRRLAGKSVLRPAVSMSELAAFSPKVARWARRRAVPKVLVASQTRVVEPVVDRIGDCLPVTPVISVEPLDADIPLELLAAVLGAPSTSARIARETAGTGLSAGSLRIRAAVLGALGVPRDADAISAAVAAWSDLEELMVTDSIEDWRRVGTRLDGALGIENPEIVDWWIGRLPGRANMKRT